MNRVSECTETGSGGMVARGRGRGRREMRSDGYRFYFGMMR